MSNIPYKETSLLRNIFYCRSLTGKFLLTALLILLMSCKGKPTEDTRPKDQLSFVHTVKGLRDRADKAANETDKALVLEGGVVSAKKYIVDTLRSTFSSWDARVLDNIKNDPDAIEVTYGLSLDNFDLSEKSRYQSIVLRGKSNDTNSALRKIIQELKIGDHVKITGSFISRRNNIDIDPYNEQKYRASKNIFVNPEFSVEISDIKLTDN